MTTKAKRHHYLPRFYLAGFSRDGLLAVYDEDREHLRLGQPANIAVRKHYYSLVDENGAKDPSVEGSLARIEGRTKPVFDALVNRQFLATEERYYLAIFLGIMACRTPLFERLLSEVLTGFVESTVRRNLQEATEGELFGVPTTEIESVLDSGEFVLEAHPNTRISQIFENGKRLGRSFYVANWTVLHTDQRNAFITCDNPFGILSPRPVPSDFGFQRYGIASREVITTFPLSAEACLLMSGAGKTLTHASATKGQARQINLSTIAETDSYAMARDEGHLRSLIKRAGLGRGRRKAKLAMMELPDVSGDQSKSILVTGRIPAGRE